MHPQKKVKVQNKPAYTNEVMLKANNEVTKGYPMKTTARKFGIPAQTLRDRVLGLVDSDNCAPGPDTLLSSEEEETLVEHDCFDISKTCLWLHQCSAATS